MDDPARECPRPSSGVGWLASVVPDLKYQVNLTVGECRDQLGLSAASGLVSQEAQHVDETITCASNRGEFTVRDPGESRWPPQPGSEM